jgi:hypothetical protein
MRKLLVVLAALAFVAAFTAPAFAAEWSFYGHVRMTTFWADEDFGDFNPYGKTQDWDDDFDLNHSLQSNSRIGANVKVSDNLIGRFEYGFDTGDRDNIDLRLLYGQYDFGAFQLRVGQDYGPVNIFLSSQVFGGDTNMLPYGGVYGGRNPLVEFRVGAFKLAFLTPKSSTSIAAAVETDVVIPKIEASYSFNIAGLSLSLQGGYNTFDAVGVDDSDESIDSYILALSAKYSAGPFSLMGDVYTGQNIGDYGIWTAGVATAGYDAVQDDVLDNDAFGFLICAAFSANENLRFEAGYGMAEFDQDDSINEDDVSSYYVNAKITFAKGVFIVPEIGVIDYGDDMFDADEGDTTYYGLQWQIRF